MMEIQSLFDVKAPILTRTQEAWKRRTVPVTKEFLMEHRIITDSNCWEWTRARDGNGYGQAVVNFIKKKVHRLAFQLWVGPIEKGKIVCHKCDNPPCFNPDHLFTGTFKDNTRDALAKGHMNHPRAKGERHGMCKLKEQQVVEILKFRKLATSDASRKELADIHSISLSTIKAILSGRQWKHVPRFNRGAEVLL